MYGDVLGQDEKPFGFGHVKFTIKSRTLSRRCRCFWSIFFGSLATASPFDSPEIGPASEGFPSGWLILSPGAIPRKTLWVNLFFILCVRSTILEVIRVYLKKWIWKQTMFSGLRAVSFIKEPSLYRPLWKPLFLTVSFEAFFLSIAVMQYTGSWSFVIKMLSPFSFFLLFPFYEFYFIAYEAKKTLNEMLGSAFKIHMEN